MVAPIQVYMLERVARVLEACTETDEGRGAIASMLDGFPNGRALLELPERLVSCPIEKRGGRLFSKA